MPKHYEHIQKSLNLNVNISLKLLTQLVEMSAVTARNPKGLVFLIRRYQSVYVDRIADRA